MNTESIFVSAAGDRPYSRLSSILQVEDFGKIRKTCHCLFIFTLICLRAVLDAKDKYFVTSRIKGEPPVTYAETKFALA